MISRRDFMVFAQDIGRGPLRALGYLEHIQGRAGWWISNPRARHRYQVYVRAKFHRERKAKPVRC